MTTVQHSSSSSSVPTTDTTTSSSNSSNNDGPIINVIVRLHLVRHGETIANVQNNVIGQTDSVC
jgi:hypothetical protein